MASRTISTLVGVPELVGALNNASRLCVRADRDRESSTAWVAKLSDAKRQGQLEAELRRLSFMAATAMIDRFIHHAEILSLKGDS
jgi:hypothetical protein